MTQVRLRNIDLMYQKTRILKDVNLTIDAGKFCVFIGPSGCGKTTLLRLIAGLEPHFGGDIEIDGTIINDTPPAERDIAMVFQNYALYPHMTVFDNMAFGLQRKRLPSTEIKRRIAEASRILQLEELLTRKPNALSGGQRQRVAIGRAIVKQPKVFLFDEPLSNLDASLRVQTRIEIAKLHRDLNSSSMIYVTHDQIEAMTLADQIVLLQPMVDAQVNSSVSQVGTSMELYHHPANLFSAGFFGSPAMNFFAATVTALSVEMVDTELDGQPCATKVSPAGLQQGQAVTLGIRPEHVLLGEGPWRGKVIHIEALGEHSYIHLRFTEHQPVLIAKTLDESIRVSDMVAFCFPAHSLHVFNGAGTAQRRLVCSR